MEKIIRIQIWGYETEKVFTVSLWTERTHRISFNEHIYYLWLIYMSHTLRHILIGWWLLDFNCVYAAALTAGGAPAGVSSFGLGFSTRSRLTHFYRFIKHTFKSKPRTSNGPWNLVGLGQSRRQIMKQSWSVFGSLNHFDLTFLSLIKPASTVAFGLQIWSILHHPSFSYALTSNLFFLSFIPAINAFLLASCSAWRLKKRWSSWWQFKV